MGKTRESKTSPRRLKAAERQAAAMALRLTGESFRSIALELGYRGPSGAFKSVEAGLRKMMGTPSEELRKLELARLDELQKVAWRHVMVTGDLKAISTVLKIMERRAKLLGLDAPTLYSIEDIRSLAHKVIDAVRAEVSDSEIRERIFDRLGF